MSTSALPSITVDDLVKRICDGYEATVSIWPTDSNKDQAMRLVFYLTTLATVRRIPYSKTRIQDTIVGFLEVKRDEAVENLPLSATELVADLLAETIL